MKKAIRGHIKMISKYCSMKNTTMGLVKDLTQCRLVHKENLSIRIRYTSSVRCNLSNRVTLNL